MTDYIIQAFEALFFTALGMTFADGILFVVILMSIIFAIQDYRIGLITMFLLSITAYIFFVLNNFSLLHVTLLIFTSLLLLAFSIYASKSNSTGGVLG
jgi:nicotinamide riboside transporter PnuC